MRGAHDGDIPFHPIEAAMNLRNLIVPVVAAAIALSACATGGLRDAEKLDLYRAHAGDPVGSFNFFGRLNGWTPLGDSAVVLTLRVWTNSPDLFNVRFDLIKNVKQAFDREGVTIPFPQRTVHLRREASGETAA
jgi:hypothetical protein